MTVFNKLASIREKGSNGNSECMDYRKNSSNRSFSRNSENKYKYNRWSPAFKSKRYRVGLLI